MIVIILKFKNLNRSIIFSICFIYIFNLSSIVYANHKVKDERIVGVGALVSSGLAFLAKAEVIAVLSAVALRLGMDMNNTTQSAVQEFCEKYPDVVTTAENFGKSENGLIAVSKNAIDKFTTFLKEFFEKNPEGTKLNCTFTIPYDSRLSYAGVTLSDYFSSSSTIGYKLELSYDRSKYEYVGFTMYKDYKLVGAVSGSELWVKLVDKQGNVKTSYNVTTNYKNVKYDAKFYFSSKYNYSSYAPDNVLSDDLGNVYTGDGDFILNPSWDINSTGVFEGLPSLPWEDKTFGSTGSIGVLNPDGTITDSPSIPDVENPDIPNTDTDEQTGILGWLTNFWENLWNFCMELIKKLFYPQKAIDAWTNLNSMIWDKFRFLGQLNGIKWTTNNNQRLRIPFNYNNRTYIIQLPDSFEENNVTYFRNIFKYFVYAITLFVCVRILRPRFTIGTR